MLGYILALVALLIVAAFSILVMVTVYLTMPLVDSVYLLGPGLFPFALGLLLLAVPTADLGNDLVWEPSRGGELFPHLYGGPLKLSTIVWEEPISVAADGSCSLPAGVK